MEAIVILAVLLIGLILFDLAALRWGVDSSHDDDEKFDREWQPRWRGMHGN